MDRESLTAEYLRRVTEKGVTSTELIGRLLESEMLAAFYKGTFLARPVFLGHAERVAAFNDVSRVFSAFIVNSVVRYRLFLRRASIDASLSL